MFIFSKQPSISLFLISLTLLLLVGSSFSTNNQIKVERVPISYKGLGLLPNPSKEINVDGDDLNVLKKHVSFFDRNKDGIVYPKETFEGFRAIGANVAVATAASAFINMGLSSKTRPGKLPSPLFPIEIENINLAKHTSDSGVYDTQGRFVPEKFEEIFQKYAHTNATYLTSDELYEMLKGNRAPNDPVGWLASTSEWRFLYTFGKDENGLLQKETIRAAYDGSVFEQLEQKNKKNA